MAGSAESALGDRIPPAFSVIAVVLAMTFLSVTQFGGYLFGPTDDLSDRRLILEVPSSQLQRELGRCMTKDWGDRLHLQYAFSPNYDPSIVRLYHPMSGAVVDLKDEGPTRRVSLFAPVSKTLSDRQKAAVTDCAISTSKAFGAAWPDQD